MPLLQRFHVPAPVQEFEIVLPSSGAAAPASSSSGAVPHIIVPELSAEDQGIPQAALLPWWATVSNNFEAHLEDERLAILSARAFCVRQYHEPVPVMSSHFVYDVSTSMSANPPRDVAWFFNPQQWKDRGGTLWEATPSSLRRALLVFNISVWLPNSAQHLCINPRSCVGMSSPAMSSIASRPPLGLLPLLRLCW